MGAAMSGPSSPRRAKRPERLRKHGAVRCKATYDLTPEIVESVRKVSTDLHCCQSDVVMHFLACGLREYRAGHLNLHDMRLPHRWSLRFEFKLPTPRVDASG